MNYQLVKQLKDAGFPQTFEVGESHFIINDNGETGIAITTENIGDWTDVAEDEGWIKIPTLSELIETCKHELVSLTKYKNGIYLKNGWYAVYHKFLDSYPTFIRGKTPKEALAKLCIKLYKEIDI